MPTRRQFLSSATLTLLTVPVAECSAHNSRQSSSTILDAGDDGLEPWPDVVVEAAPPPDATPDGTANDAAADGEAGPCNGASDTSTEVPDPQRMDMLHSHDVCVPAADLGNPPAGGATYTSSTVLGHTHTVTLSPDQIQNIGGAMVVTVTSSTVLDHEHVFIFNT